MKLFLIGLYLLSFGYVMMERKTRADVEEALFSSIRSISEQAFVYWDGEPYFDEKRLNETYQVYWENNLPSDLDYRYTIELMDEEERVCKSRCTAYVMKFYYPYFGKERREMVKITIQEKDA